MSIFIAMSPTVTLDFHEDVRREVIKLLTRLGYSVDREASLEKLVRQLINYEHRSIRPQIRKSVRSKELSQKIGTLKLEHQHAITEIERRSQAGGNLNSFLSERLTNIDHNDLLLNDWHIYHFHLGSTSPRKNGFVRTSKELLYAYTQPHALYLINVFDHNAFGKQELVEILHRNWPSVIHPFKATGFTANPVELSAREREIIRHRGVQVLVTTSDGTTYWPFGRGYSSAGLSTRVVVGADEFFFNVRNWQTMCQNNTKEILAKINAKTGKKLENIFLELKYTNDGWLIIECQTNFVILLNFGISPKRISTFQL